MRGHVRKRGKRWAIVLDAGRDPNTGKRRQEWHSGFRTEEDAERQLAKLLVALDEGTYVTRSRRTLGTFLQREWLPAVRVSLAESTFETYERNVRAHIVPALGSIPLQALTPAALTAFYGERLRAGRLNAKSRGQPLSPRTVRYLHAIIHKALADAMKWGMVARNVATVAEPPSAKRAKAAPPTTWSAEELRRFLAHVRTDRLYALWLLYATTGARRGEALGLHWPDVDLAAGRAAIRESQGVVSGRVTPSGGKSDRGKRGVALDAGTVNALRDHRKRQLEERLAFGPAWQDTGRVFTREDGSDLHPESIFDAFVTLAAQAGLPRIRLHDLRHTWATLALAAGVNPKVVSERLGHASVAFTLDTYSHVMPGMQQDAADTVARLVLGQ